MKKVVSAVTRLFRKKGAAQPPQPEPTDPFVEKGREVGRAIVTTVENYIDTRFQQIRSGFLKVLQGQLDSARAQSEVSPILLARHDISKFNEQVALAEDHLVQETLDMMAEWSDVTAAMGADDMIPVLVKKLCADRFSDLIIEGVHQLVKNADLLKDADNEWKRNNPQAD